MRLRGVVKKLLRWQEAKKVKAVTRGFGDLFRSALQVNEVRSESEKRNLTADICAFQDTPPFKQDFVGAKFPQGRL